MPEPQASQGGVRPPWRRPAFWLLVGAVALAHSLISRSLLDNRLGWGAGNGPPPPIEVAFVLELAATQTPAPAPAPRRSGARALPAVAAQAASAPLAAAEPALPDPTPAPAIAATPADAAPAPAPDVAPAQGVAAASAPPAPPAAPVPPLAAAASAPAAPRFEWPPSTRLNYRLTGHYKGPIEGSAQVEWLRQGLRYQVRMETSLGPLIARQIVSEGELTEQGLAPRRFDAQQRVAFSTRRWGLRFTPEQVTLTDGREVPTLPGVQDEASQFVHLTWLFSTQPERLRVGQTIEMPLVLTRRLDRWLFDVVAQETLQLPFGPVETFHIKPRREAGGGDMTAEMWLAPSYQYLPVRVVIRQNQESYADLSLQKPPMQAAPAPVPTR